jgi:molybdenum cofactor biosynthesis enzyme MoaA
MKIQTFSIIAGTASCNANCPYCISKMTGTKKIGFKEPVINWRNFDKACRLAQISGVTTTLITGKGEPALYPEQITKFLEHLKRFDFPLIELQTNGIILNKKEYDQHLKKWYSLGLNTIAISIAHYKDERNQEVYTQNKQYPALKELVKKLHKIGFSVRLSCILINNFIDTPKEVQELAKFAKENEVEQLTIRKLGIISESESKQVWEWCNNHVMSQEKIDALKDHLDKEAKLLMTLPHGAFVYELAGQNICITDCQMIHPKTDEIRTLIFFPDGHLRYDWSFGGAILM